MRQFSPRACLVVLALLAPVALAEDADEVREKGIAALKESQSNPRAIVEAARLFVKAAELYNAAGNEEKNVEMNSFLYWCKKKMTLADIEAFTKGGETAVTGKLAALDKVVPKADDAQKWFDRADQFAKKNPSEHLLIAVRFFEVADRFKGSDASFAAQDRSLKEQLLDKSNAVKTIVQPNPVKPADTATDIDKRPIPPADELKKADTLIKDLLKADYAKTDAASRQALIATLLQQADENKKNAALEYVVLHEARDLAVVTGDSAKAMEIQNRLCDAFKLDFAAMLLDLKKLESSAKTADPATALATLFAMEAGNALAAADYDQAVRFNSHAEDLLPISKDPALKARLKTEIPRVQAIKRDSVAALAAQKTLATKPEDPDANLTAGKFALLLGDLEKAMPLLAKGKDGVLSAHAKRELAPPQDAAEQVLLADGWFDRAEKELSAYLKTHMQDRAAFWYMTALPGLTGVDKLKVTTRLKTLPQVGAGAAVVQVPKSIDVAPKNRPEKIVAGKELVLDLGGGVKMELIPIPAGTFMMGSSLTEMGRGKDEVLHSVTISRPFYMAKFLTTQEQYELIMGENPSGRKEAKFPVENVKWTDAQEFLEKLNGKVKDQLPAGTRLQLPTEAQWEYACRAGTKTRFNSGDADDALGLAGWFEKNNNALWHPVGEKKPNAWGLFDMHGSVWQWCTDWKGDYPNGHVQDPQGPSTGIERIVRGGNIFETAARCRSATRHGGEPNRQYAGVGFRAVLLESGAAIETRAPVSAVTSIGNLKKELTIDLGGGVKMEFVRIPAGSFQMGSPEGEPERNNTNEKQHRVTISTDFYMGKYTVTQEQYETVMGTNPSDFKAANGGGPKNPVEQVTWDDAQAFCKKVSQLTGRKVMLPTEAQWEYACRAGTAGPFNFAGKLSTDKVNYKGEFSYDGSEVGEFRGKTVPVSSFAPNAWGLYQMHGNVWQWCEDLYMEKYQQLPSTDPLNTTEGTVHVLRGASWVNRPLFCRSANRSNAADMRYTGFRVVIVAGSVPAAVAPAATAIGSIGNLKKEVVLDLGGGVKLELVAIPAGTFQMGSPQGEDGRDTDEKQHAVTLSRPFYMAKFSTTQEQFESIMKKNPSRFKDPKNPVEKVSWNDAVEFCAKLNTRIGAQLPGGLSVQLPTEAQWEFACRAGAETRYYSGNEENDLKDIAWFNQNSDGKTHPVGQKKPNPFGLYDMLGNVRQWCQDVYLEDYEKLTGPDPLYRGTGSTHVLHGGAWDTDAKGCRIARRVKFKPDERHDVHGFRVVVAMPRK